LTVPVKPFTGEIWSVAVVEPSGDAVRLVELDVSPNDTPVPLSAMVCGEPFALSLMVSVPVRATAAVGVNVTDIVQFDPAATLVPQLLAWAKSPEAAMELSVSVACAEFVSVTDCAALVVPVVCEVKVMLVGESVTTGTVAPMV
jgi:hypothetical protein